MTGLRHLPQPSADRPFDICGVGEIDVDMYLQVPVLPLPTEKTRGDRIEFHPGGMIGNFLANARRCGMRVAHQGRVGDDPFGLIALDSLRQEGVDVTRTTRRAEDPTFFAVVLYDGIGEKQLVTAVTECKDFGPEDIDKQLLGQCRHVHTNLTPHTGWLVAEARAQGCSVSVDLDEPPSNDTGEWVMKTDILFLAERREGSGPPKPEMIRLLTAGCRMIVTTKGEAGATVHRLVSGKLEITAVHTPPVDVVDTTGAGDCFAAWLVAGLLNGEPLPDSLQLASAAASLSTQGRGSRSAIPSLSEAQHVAKDLRVSTSMHDI